MTIKLWNPTEGKELVLKDFRTMKRSSTGNIIIKDYIGSIHNLDFTKWTIDEVVA